MFFLGLGALTHGDRRATESRDLSRFNIDNKYGRLALDATFKTIMGYEAPIVPPPADYQGEFFKGNFQILGSIELHIPCGPAMLSRRKSSGDPPETLRRGSPDFLG